MVFGVETSGENFNACFEIFLDVPMSWRSMAITHVRRRSFGEPLVHGGAALAMPKFVHRQSIGRLKNHVCYLLSLGANISKHVDQGIYSW